MDCPTTEDDQRRQLGAFLRARREALNPGGTGLASHGRRRTSGLRPEEVAVLSGISTTWYTWLEQAREIALSAAALARLADALRLTPAERACCSS
jgi:transcriptional regulator with XRE-family HTH domain